MKKAGLLCLVIVGICYASVFGQTVGRDTIYVYETVFVYDTLIIHDTVRIGKALNVPPLQPIENLTVFFDPPTATFSENGIILHESKSQKKSKIMSMKLNMKLKLKNISYASYLSGFIMTAQSMAGISAQETPSETDLKTFPAQMSIVYPMTTQGSQTIDYRYFFSFNLFSGKVGAVTGLEFGSFLNKVEKDMNGVQIGGLFNLTHDAVGLQFGGLGNASKTAKGVQFGGLGNITENATGLQFGGLANIGEKALGIQLSGITNITGDAGGFQFGGIANFTEKYRGAQVGGIINMTNESRGFRFAGITNLGKSHQGAQVSGIVNVTGENDGFQFAGVANLSEEVSGVSIGGLFNRTGTLKGFQFGIVNVTDTIEKGFSMAIINIVKKGFYDEWALTFSDYMNVGLSYKAGIQKFYTIYTIGGNFIEDKLWVAGIGFGNRTALGKRIDFQPEIISYSYFPSDFKNAQPTWATHLKLGFVYNITDKLGISVAPSIYQLSSDLKDGSDVYKVSPISSFWSHTNDSYKNSVGVGISVGLILM